MMLLLRGVDATWFPHYSCVTACLLLVLIPECHGKGLPSTDSSWNLVLPNKSDASLAAPPQALPLIAPTRAPPPAGQGDVAASVVGNEETKAIPLSQEIICQSLDIANAVEQFDLLRNCTVIEGYLNIALIDHPEKPYENLSYPSLREVTEYVLIYRVTGLKTLRNLFPNLSVIRGNKLVRNSALTIFENNDLEEIGLIGLTRIVRGSVYIWRNSHLCYVDTINWKGLTDKDSWDSNSIRENRQENQCADVCAGQCASFFNDKKSRPMCWTAQDCQKGPQPRCESPQPKRGSCCSHFCLAGCFGAARNECLVCQQVHYEGACFEYCPARTFMLLGRRCVTEDFCRNYTKPGTRIKFKAYTAIITDAADNKLEQGSCVSECPPGFTVDSVDPHKCMPCVGFCPKVCAGRHIITLSDAESFKGCTSIRGNLEIQIAKGEQIARALETGLENVEEVTGYVSITRSHALLSLSFFKKLRLIKGEQLVTGTSYAFNVIDNQNLKELPEFSPARQFLIIGNPNATVRFQFNPQLCRDAIDKFVRHINASKGIDDYDDHDIGKTSNGDRAACDIQGLKLRVIVPSARFATLTWDLINLPDSRSLLGYVLYYREAPAQNLTKFQGADVCGASVWTQVDADAPPPEGHLLYDLLPARQYGIYVKAYTVASERRGAQSDIVYFTTKSMQPERPMAVRTESLNSSAISIHWKPPVEPNGAIVRYVVSWHTLPDKHRNLAIRNYCTDPVNMPRPTDELQTTTPLPLNSCPCGASGTGKPAPSASANRAQAEYEEAIEMENHIQDSVYIKTSSRRKRAAVITATSSGPRLSTTTFLDSTSGFGNVSTPSSAMENATSSATVAVLRNDTSPTETIYSTTAPPITRDVFDSTSFVIHGLVHFTDYIISVKACQEHTDAHEPCSKPAVASTTQTLAKRGADNIPSDSVQVNMTRTEADKDAIRISWSDPKEPNGVIVTVDLEIKNAVHGSWMRKICMARTTKNHKLPVYQLDEGFLQTMPSGNYSFSLLASSFAGNGSWTEPLYMYVEQPTIAGTGFHLSSGQLAGIICGVLFPCLLLLAVGCWRYKPWIKKIPQDPLIVSVNPDYYSYTPDEWEVPRSKIELIKEIGTGSFGKVYLAIGRNIEADREVSRVAVKTVNEDKTFSERMFFLKEASVMKQFCCNHVVKLIGVVSEGQPALVIMELMERGDLKTYLREQRPDEGHPNRIPPTLSRIYQMAGEICDGMAYIHARKYVHRDLAARNCMINDQLTVKIGDFGMTRDVYETDYYRKGGKGLLPVRWMAPESLRDGLFTNESDVWSFGVVLWEIVTLAEQPYRGLSNEEVLNFVIAGDRRNASTGEIDYGYMAMPEGCDVELYSLMVGCWQYDAKKRPTFMDIIAQLAPRLSETFHEKAYFSTVDHTDPLAGDGDGDSADAAAAVGEHPVNGQELQDVAPKVFTLSMVRPPPGGSDDDEEEDPRETDHLLDQSAAGDRPLSSPPPPQHPFPAQDHSPIPPPYPLEVQTDVIHQNGGSAVSSADNSRSMAMTFQADGGGGGGHVPHVKSNGSVTNGILEKAARTLH